MKEATLTYSKFNQFLYALLLCAGLAAFNLGAQESPRDLTVIRGSSVKIDVPEGVRHILSPSDKAIEAKVNPDDGKSVLVLGLAEGVSELRIERLQGPDLVYRVSVRPDLQSTADQIKELLSDVIGLDIKIVGGKIVFEGKIKTQADWEKVTKVEAAYSGVILNMSTFDQREMAEVIKTVILRDLKDIGIETVTVQVNGDTVVLDGVVYSDLDMQRAIKKAELRMPKQKVVSLLRVQEVVIETDLQFVEVDRENDSSFGNNVLNAVQLNGTANLANSGKPKLSLGATASASVNAQLTALNAKNIYQNHISSVSGQEQSSKLGGTIYVPVAGNIGGSILPIPYGVIIKVKSTMQGRDRILTEVAVEVSTAVSSGGQTSTTEFKTSTSVITKVGETAVLSGFAQALVSGNDNKTPILGDIPLLNLLFAQKSKSKIHKEGVLLLTPRPSLPETATGPAYSERAKTILKDAASK